MTTSRLCCLAIWSLCLSTATVAQAPSAQTVTAACEGLAAQRLPNTTITTAQAVTGGSFTPPGSSNAITNLPPFCRVAGEIAPTSDSHILFEVWLPLAELEWQVLRRRQRRLGGHHLVRRARRTDPARIRRGASTNTGHEAGPAWTWPDSRSSSRNS